MVLGKSIGLGLVMAMAAGLLTVAIRADIENGGKSTTTTMMMTGSTGAESDDRGRLTGMPLVVSVPSKVFRANKVNSNDVFERPIDLHAVLLEEEEEAEAEQQLRRQNPRLMMPKTLPALPVFMTTTTTTSTTTAGTRTTTTTAGTSSTTAAAAKSIRTTTTTTEATSDEQNDPSRKRVDGIEEAKREPSSKTRLASNDSMTSATPSTTTTEVPRVTTVAEVAVEEVTARSSSAADKPESEVATTTSAPPRSDEIIEHDYGKSVGSFSADDSAERSTKTEDDDEAGRRGEEVVADADADSDSELGPMEVEGARESQLDYFVVAADGSEVAGSRGSRDVSLFHDGGRRQSSTSPATVAREDVVTSMSYSMAVLHPLGAAAIDKPVSRKKLVAAAADEFVAKRKRPVFSKVIRDDDRGSPAMVVLMSNESEPETEPELEAAASEQRFLRLLAPELDADAAGGSRDARQTDGSTALEDEDDADPPVLSDDGEYEYIYEYIDLNSTDVDPDNLPEGAVIVTDEQLESGRPLFPSPVKDESNVTVQINDTVNDSDNDSAAIASAVDAAADVAGVQGPPPPSTLPPPPEVSKTGDDPTPFVVAGMPESPVYFVGIRTEKIDGDQKPPPPPSSSVIADDREAVREQPPPTIPKDANDVADLMSTTDRGTEVQLTSLYALSQALPFDEDSMSKMLNGNESGSLLLPVDLPDPFSEELLRGDVAKSNETMTTEPMTTLPELTTEAATTMKTTTMAPKTTAATTTTTTTEPPTIATPKADAGRGAGRPRGTRRSTTTTESPPASDAPAKKTRPTRPGGRRRSTTPAPVDDADIAETGTTAMAATTTATERPKFGGRGRGRFATSPRTSRPAAVTAAPPVEAEAEAEAASDSSNSIAGNGGKRGSSGRRTTTGRSAAAVNITKDEQKVTRKSNRPAAGSSPRGRRPTTTTTRAGADKTATTKPTSDDEGESAEAATPRKSQLFRPRNRGRFGPKSKVTAPAANAEGEEEHDDTDAADEHHPDAETPSAAATSPTPTTAAATNEVSGVTEAVQSADADDAEADADVGTLRKFPPRFRPGSRATIPHRTTEPSAAAANA